jgi:Na+/phosphate symporter
MLLKKIHKNFEHPQDECVTDLITKEKKVKNLKKKIQYYENFKKS